MLPDTAQSFRGTLNIHVWIRFLNWKKKKKFIVDIDEEDANIVVEKPASIEDPKVS